jgi:hypothetical protein
MRAISTVLDVTVCLLRVSAAVGTLLVPTTSVPTVSADETAEQLATTTTNVSAPVGPIGGRAFGTTAELLGRAAVANLTLSGERLTPTTVRFRSAVRRRVRQLIDRAPARTAVTANWRPYSGAPIRGRLTVGPSPPPRATVSTARLSVSLPVRSDWTDAAEGYDALAHALSGEILAYTLPRGNGPSRPVDRVDERIAAYDRVLGSSSVADRRRSLAGRLAADLRHRFDTPAAAVDALRPARIVIVVREWEA